jgi:Ni/Co efflux regulator RcnB
MTRSTKTLLAFAALIGLSVAGGPMLANAAPDANARQGYSENANSGKHGDHRRDGHRGKHEGRHGDKHERRHADRHEGRHHGKGHGHGYHGKHGYGPRHNGFIAEFFERYDVDGTGKIKIEEILTLRGDELKKFDKNGDGQLDLQEYETLWLDKMREHMVRSFQRYDRDGNAQVTPEEYNRQVERLAKRLDRNKDGTIEKFDRRGGKDRSNWHRSGGKNKMERAPAEQQAPAADDATSDEADTE